MVEIKSRAFLFGPFLQVQFVTKSLRSLFFGLLATGLLLHILDGPPLFHYMRIPTNKFT